GTMRIRFCEQARLRDKRLLLCCMLLFFLSILTVLHRVDFRSSLAITVVALLLLDKTIFCRVDYSLLLTFVAFFVFVGNLGRLPSIQTMVSSLMTGREFLAGVLLSQLISNVPAAVMLSGFTGQARALLLGVNVGGLGTLVASLASLISFRLYAKSEHAQPGLFIRVFTAYNGLILLLLIAVVWILPQ
ncbi:MAG: citrate transporter, partial [Oscillospiraceae bacterium]